MFWPAIQYMQPSVPPTMQNSVDRNILEELAAGKLGKPMSPSQPPAPLLPTEEEPPSQLTSPPQTKVAHDDDDDDDDDVRVMID